MKISINKIKYYATVTTIEKLTNKSIHNRLKKLYPQFFAPKKDKTFFSELTKIEEEMRVNEEKYRDEIISDLLKKIDKENIKWIGFKLWSGYGYKTTVQIANAIKNKHPKMFIFGGGPCVEIYMGAIYQDSKVFDALVFGEGENVILSLIEHVKGKKDLSEIPSIFYLGNGEVKRNKTERITNMDKLPIPNYDHKVYPTTKEDKLTVLNYDESRGCPRYCYFCPSLNKYGTKRMQKTAKHIVKELKILSEKYKTRVFRFAGANTPKEILMELSAEIIKHKLDIRYSIFCDVMDFTKDMLIQMKKSGLDGIFFGLESANKEILVKSLGKPLNITHARQVFKHCRELNIFISCSLIYPSPNETEESKNETKQFLKDTIAGYENSAVTMLPAGMYPNTTWSKRHDHFGFNLKNMDMNEYTLFTLHYNLKAIMPVELWDDLPYTLNGKTFKELLAETGKFYRELTEIGINTYLKDDTALIGNHLKIKPNEFSKIIGTMIMTADVEGLRKKYKEINSKL